MIVMKFGGTSVKDAVAIRNVVQIIGRELDRTPLVVVSACAGATDALIRIAEKDASGATEEAIDEIASLRNRHLAIATALLDGNYRVVVQEALREQFGQVETLLLSVSLLNELSVRALDRLTSFGERWSSLLLTYALLQRGITTHLVDARKVLVTNEDFTRAAPYFDLTESKAKEFFLPLLQQGSVVVTQGFIGATPDGVTTTIGRNGSDYSAAIFGSALGVEEIQIWSDVDGILTADPSLIPDAHPVKEMTLGEAAELAYFGAKVLHPSTILPVMRKNIPVRVLNSRRPEADGTRIRNCSSDIRLNNGISQALPCVVKSIAYKEGVTVVTIRSTQMLMAHGFLARLFEVFARYKKSVDVVATSEVAVSLTVDDDSGLDSVVSELRQFADVRVDHKRAVCCVVGENMKYTKGVAARAFTALDRAGVNVELVSHGGSEINLTFVISELQVEAAVKSLHGEFFTDGARPAALIFQSSNDNERVTQQVE